MITVTTHWNHVTNRGASRELVSSFPLGSRALLMNTNEIETTLWVTQRLSSFSIDRKEWGFHYQYIQTTMNIFTYLRTKDSC